MTDVYFGTTITDPYRWLENWHEGKAADWLKAQGAYTRSALAAISGRDKVFARVIKQALLHEELSLYFRIRSLWTQRADSRSGQRLVRLYFASRWPLSIMIALIPFIPASL